MTMPQIYLVIGIAFSVILICGAILFINRYTLTRIKAERHKVEKTKEEANTIIQQSQHALRILAQHEAQITQMERQLTDDRKKLTQIVNRYAYSFRTVNEDNFSFKGISNLFDVLSPKEHVLFDVAFNLLEGECSYRKLYQTLHKEDEDTVSFITYLETEWGIEAANQLKYTQTFIRDTLQKRESTLTKTGLVPITLQEMGDTFYLLQGKQGTSRQLVSGTELIRVWKKQQETKEPDMDKETAQILAENKAKKQVE